MTRFKRGDKVTVKSFEGTVTGTDSTWGLTRVTDAEGHTYFVDASKLKGLPYKDGQSYIDNGYDVYVFHKATDEEPAHWTSEVNGVHGTAHAIGYPVIPLREIGPEIQE